MRVRAVFGLIFAITFAARLCHLRILWIEECYPAAGAIQALWGKLPYRDFWFDKPPLPIGLYVLWGGADGLPLRLAGALFVTLTAWLLFRFAREKWGEDEGLICAALTAFFLTFGIPSAVMAMAPDLLLVAPHAAAVYMAWRRQPFWSGVLAGVAMLTHTKGVYVLAACLLWQYKSVAVVAAGFLLPNSVALFWLLLSGSLGAYWQQVWEWGMLYARDTFVGDPVGEGLRRTANWAGFHALLLAAGGWYWWREKDGDSRRLLLWALISVAGVAAGWRFFPRYYFQLLPVFLLAAARGLTLLGRRRALAVSVLLLIPFFRFAPRYVDLAGDLITGDQHEWRDLAMYEGSRKTATRFINAGTHQDTLLVWGYRPDIFVLTRMRAGTPFLDSQPLTGVIADRHLFETVPTAPKMAAENRQRLTQSKPSFIVDGLGVYNPALAIEAYPGLQPWLEEYFELWRDESAVVYQRRAEH